MITTQLELDPRRTYHDMRVNDTHFPCTFGLRDGCYHFQCRMAWLKANGLESLATRLERNAEARYWVGNFGKLLYDPKRHYRDSKRRAIMARLIRHMRNGTADYMTALSTGAWIGAQL